MEHKRTETVPASTREVVDHYACDVCGAKLRARTYRVDEVTVTREVGTSTSDSGNLTHTEFDLCGACFESKLVPFLESLGAKPRVRDGSY